MLPVSSSSRSTFFIFAGDVVGDDTTTPFLFPGEVTFVGGVVADVDKLFLFPIDVTVAGGVVDDIDQIFLRPGDVTLAGGIVEDKDKLFLRPLDAITFAGNVVAGLAMLFLFPGGDDLLLLVVCAKR